MKKGIRSFGSGRLSTDGRTVLQRRQRREEGREAALVAVTLAVAAAADAAAAARANRLVSGVGKSGCRERCLTCNGLTMIASH